MKEEKFFKLLDQLSREHPAHPYTVPIFEYSRSGTGKCLGHSYVRSASPDRAKLSAVYWWNIGKRSQQRVIAGRPEPDMPIELNRYWGFVNNANPEGLQLNVDNQAA